MSNKNILKQIAGSLMRLEGDSRTIQRDVVDITLDIKALRENVETLVARSGPVSLEPPETDQGRAKK